ncbi:DNA-directed RNA polymerase subunit H [Candidatus Micrarchaeota archaeon]|nr:DNA-directed RNA polymerase subunit H [Candidatus Micrarchaeota archaeon]
MTAENASFNHFLVPKAVVATEKELKEVLEKHSITLEALPLLKSTDPQAISLNATSGAVIKFLRKNYLGREETYYRRVVD